MTAPNLACGSGRVNTRRGAHGAGGWLAFQLHYTTMGRPATDRTELALVFAAGHARCADARHLATALFLTEGPGDLPFITLDQRQQAVARALGFPPPHPEGP